MGGVDESVSFTEDILEECRGLRKARVVLRNPLGLAELFVDLASLEMRGGWANVCLDDVHLHAEISAIAGVRFLDGGSGCQCAGPAIWFAARNGSPLLLIVLDQVKGAERVEQERAFARLRDSYGAARALVSTAEVPDRGAMS